MNRNGCQRGLSLPEILVTLAISSILVTGMIRVFSDLKRIYFDLIELTELLNKKDQFIALMINYIHDAGSIAGQYIHDNQLPYVRIRDPNHFAILQQESTAEFYLQAQRTHYVSCQNSFEIRTTDQLVFSNAENHAIRQAKEIHVSGSRYELKLNKIIDKDSQWTYLTIARYYDFELRANQQGKALYVDPGFGRAEALIDGIENIAVKLIEKQNQPKGVHISIDFKNNFHRQRLRDLSHLEFDVAFEVKRGRDV